MREEPHDGQRVASQRITNARSTIAVATVIGGIGGGGVDIS